MTDKEIRLQGYITREVQRLTDTMLRIGMDRVQVKSTLQKMNIQIMRQAHRQVK